MNFLKGAIIGMVAGACIGYMENESICKIMKKGFTLFLILHLIFPSI